MALCRVSRLVFQSFTKSTVRRHRQTFEQNFDLFQKMLIFMASFISAGGQPDRFLDPLVEVQGEDIKSVIIPPAISCCSFWSMISSMSISAMTMPSSLGSMGPAIRLPSGP